MLMKRIIDGLRGPRATELPEDPFGGPSHRSNLRMPLQSVVEYQRLTCPPVGG